MIKQEQKLRRIIKEEVKKVMKENLSKNMIKYMKENFIGQECIDIEHQGGDDFIVYFGNGMELNVIASTMMLGSFH